MNQINECPHCGDRWAGDDEHHCIESLGDNAEYRLTPKGCLIAEAAKEGLSYGAATRIWDRLEAFCVRLAGEGEYAALIFDGEGGAVIGAEKSA